MNGGEMLLSHLALCRQTNEMSIEVGEKQQKFIVC